MDNEKQIRRNMRSQGVYYYFLILVAGMKSSGRTSLKTNICDVYIRIDIYSLYQCIYVAWSLTVKSPGRSKTDPEKHADTQRVRLKR